MPIYGDEKRRQMARSTLPSTSRKAARDDLATAKRSSRRTLRQNLRALNQGFASAEAVDEAYLDSRDDYNEYPDLEIQRVMWSRRDREKLGPALRWAPHQVAHLRRLDRLSHMYTIMPDTMAGRHAVGHMDYLDEFRIEHPSRYVFTYEPSGRQVARERDAELKPRLEAVIDLNLLDWFNSISLWERPHEITQYEFENAGHSDKVFKSPNRHSYHQNRHWWLRNEDVKWLDKINHPAWSMPAYYKLVMEPLELKKGQYMIGPKRYESHLNRYLRRSNGHWSVARALKECGV